MVFPTTTKQRTKFKSTTMPTLTAEGKAKLDGILQENVASGEIPASTFAVATASGDPFYIKTEGSKVFGEPDKGAIDENTGRCGVAATAPR